MSELRMFFFQIFLAFGSAFYERGAEEADEDPASFYHKAIAARQVEEDAQPGLKEANVED